MSYFGIAVLARHPRHLRDLESVANIDSFADVDEQGYADEWRLGYVDSPEYHDPAEVARQLVAETAAPAIALYINDSDYANGACSSPQGNVCEFYLDEAAFLRFLDDFDEEDVAGHRVRRNDIAVPVLIRWASEAELTATRDALTVALATSPGPPDDGVQWLIEALGIGR